MKIAIISDTHGSITAFNRAMEVAGPCDFIVHAGDILYHGPRNPLPEGYKPQELANAINALDVPFVAAAGNCDAPIDQALLSVPIQAPYFENADLLITADCVAIAYPNYHLGMLKGKTVVMGCPKLDNGNYYIEKLTAILKNNNINSITVAHMEVPCCFGMIKIVEEALCRSGKDISIKSIQVSIEGEIMN